MKPFSISELNNSNQSKTKSDSVSENFVNTHLQKVESLKQLVKHMPGAGEIYFIWTLNSFNAFTFIPYVFNVSGEIDEIVICTYSINKRIIDSLIRFIDKGRVGYVNLFISDSIKYRLPRVYDHLEAIISNRKNIIVNYAWNHSKIALAKSGDNYFVFEGSGNFSENAQYEQYVFLNSKVVYDFRKSCIDSINR